MADNTIQSEIAANLEDVKELLRDNRNLSIAFLSRRLTDLESDIRGRIRQLEHDEKRRYKSLEEAIHDLSKRLNTAGKKFKGMSDELEKVKERLSKEY